MNLCISIVKFAALNILLYYTVDIGIDDNIHHRLTIGKCRLKRIKIKQINAIV